MKKRQFDDLTDFLFAGNKDCILCLPFPSGLTVIQFVAIRDIQIKNDENTNYVHWFLVYTGGL